jgi:serine/threonine protein kinase
MVYKTDNYKLLGYQIQLLDFGFARKLDSPNSKDFGVNGEIILGSPHYISPEAIEGDYSFQGDIWSIGIMLYFAHSLVFPFEGSDDDELFTAIKENPLKFEPESAWRDVPYEMKELLEMMLQKNPEERIKIEDVPRHPAFKDIHVIEKKVHLTSEDKTKLSKYYRLTPIQRKFMKYSTKFIPPKEKVIHCEKFTLLDNDNTGFIEFFPQKPKSIGTKSISR